MYKFNCLLLALIFLLAGNSGFTQNDSLRVKQEDSLHYEIVKNQSQQLKALENARLHDSLKKMELVQQLNSLKSTEVIKKQELEKQLEEIKNKDSIRLAQKKQKIDSLRTFVKGYAVRPFTDTLFLIYNNLGSFSPRDRAEYIDQRINKLYDDYFFDPDSLKVVDSDLTSDITYGEQIIMSVSEYDALWMNTTKEKLAQIYRQKIADAVNRHKKETSWQTILKEVALALLVISIVIIIIIIISRFFQFIKKKIFEQKGKRIKGIKIRKYQLFDVKRELEFLFFITNIFKWVVIITVIYLALPVLFNIFPWTKNFSNVLISYFLHPIKFISRSIWHYLPNLITIIVIVVVFTYILKAFNFLKEEVERGNLKITGFYPDWANPTYQIIRVLILAFMLIVIFPYMPGSDSPVFKGVSVFLGVLFTFGSAGALSNVVAGLVLTYMRAFKIGDRVKIGDQTGDIIEKSLLVTRLRTIKNEIISIPNSTVMSSHTINYSSDALANGLIVHTTITIGYDAPWRQVHQLLIDAAKATDMIEQEPAPFVLQTSLNDFYVSYQINAFTKEPNRQAVIYSQLHSNIQDHFNKAGVEIMSPHYSTLRDGNRTTIPADYLPENYVEPAFRVQQEKGKQDTK